MFLSPDFKDVWDYWDQIRGDKIIPDKKDFQPMEIARNLRMISLLAWEGEEWVNRVIGSKVVEEVGVDLAGKKLRGKTHDRVNDFTEHHMRTIMNHPAGWQGRFVERGRSGVLREADILCLPLKLDDDGNNQIIAYRSVDDDSTIGVDTAHPDLVILGINRMSMIDLGAGLPPIDMEDCLASTRYDYPF